MCVSRQESFLQTNELESNARNASDLLKAMANETRLLILCQLVEQERSVGELVEILGLGQSALSQHLAILRQQGLVQPRRSARSVYYSLNGEEPRAIIETLHALYAYGGIKREELLKKIEENRSE